MLGGASSLMRWASSVCRTFAPILGRTSDQLRDLGLDTPLRPCRVFPCRGCKSPSSLFLAPRITILRLYFGLDNLR